MTGHRVAEMALASVLVMGAAGAVTTGGIAAATPRSTALPGSLDTSFGTGGTVLTDLTSLGLSPVALNAVVQPNGDIVVSGAFGLARYLPAGQLDKSFGSGGIAAAFGGLTGIQGTGVAIQPDGKIILAGSKTDPAASPASASELAVTRYNANGTPDTSFGTGGVVGTEVFTPPVGGTSAAALAVLVQPDGKILVGGGAGTFIPVKTRVSEGFVARYTAAGSLDTSFGTGGEAALTAIPQVAGLGLDAAGDIYALPSSLQAQPAEAELSPAGTLDATVAASPLAAVSAGSIVAALVPSGGQFVTAVEVPLNRRDTISDIAVDRFTAAGTLSVASPDFNFAGAAGSFRDFPGAVALASNGDVIVGGDHASSTGNPVFGLAAVSPAGTLDTSFGNGGTVTTTLQGDDGIAALASQPDGKIVAVGVSIAASTGHAFLALARYNG
jgi:uncharacterized delta-60 repeat protein